MFILLAGVTAGISNNNRKDKSSVYIYKKVVTILVPYLVATIIYHLIDNNYILDFSLLKSQLIKFNGASPFYFLLFYIQLIILSPLLYRMFSNRPVYSQMLILIVIYFISKYANHYTIIHGYYGGAGRLFGGSYLFVFSMGIVAYLNLKWIKEMKIWAATVTLILVIAIAYIYSKTSFLAGGWSNPPNKYTIMYTFLVVITGYCIFHIIQYKRLSKISFVLELLGKSSLYIFLYHLLFMSTIKEWFVIDLSLNVVGKIMYVCSVFFLCVLVGYFFNNKNSIYSLLFKK